LAASVSCNVGHVGIQQVRPAGAQHPRARLTDHDAWLIRQLRAAGLSYVDIAAKVEVSETCIRYCCQWRTYWCRHDDATSTQHQHQHAAL
jgi:hypothetical protein